MRVKLESIQTTQVTPNHLKVSRLHFQDASVNACIDLEFAEWFQAEMPFMPWYAKELDRRGKELARN